MSKEVLILLDADVVIHFFKADKVSLLNELFPRRLRMLDIVLDELRNNRTVSPVIDNLFVLRQVEEIRFPTHQLLKEFAALKTTILGKGERACLLYCKHNQHIIASSNTSDIVPFCRTHDIAYLTTLDLLSIALHRTKITIAEADECIHKIISNGSHLTCHSIEEYRKKFFDANKLNY